MSHWASSRSLDAFERGADEYIGIPFVPDDLVARAHAVIRRTHGVAEELVPRLASVTSRSTCSTARCSRAT